MKHLKDVQMGYLKHLLHAWRLAGILVVHGFFPWIWENKASEELNKRNIQEP